MKTVIRLSSFMRDSKGIAIGCASLWVIRRVALPVCCIGEFSQLPRLLFQLVRMFPQSVRKTRHTRFNVLRTDVVSVVPETAASFVHWGHYRADELALILQLQWPDAADFTL